MNEYFITARSFAAPFVSDTLEGYIEAVTPEVALTKYAAEFSHPAGLYAAECHLSADAFHKKQAPLAKWRSYAHQQQELADKDPKEGSIVK